MIVVLWIGDVVVVGKVCVYELVKEFGVISKEVFVWLSEQGEFVKLVLLMVEVLVVCWLCELFGGSKFVLVKGIVKFFGKGFDKFFDKVLDVVIDMVVGNGKVIVVFVKVVDFGGVVIVFLIIFVVFEFLIVVLFSFQVFYFGMVFGVWLGLVLKLGICILCVGNNLFLLV